MILFYNDWLKYNKAIIHTDTKNKSFLHIAQLYKEMGIKNHAFLLALHNPDLRNIDPNSDNLTTEEIAMIVEEVSVNPWYFFRECLRIPSSGTLTGVNFIANRGNIAYIWNFFNHTTSMLIMPRQTGKSVVSDSVDVYTLIAGGTNLSIFLFTKDNGLRVKNINRIKDIFSILPWYLNPRDKSDSNNTENITVNVFNNRLDTGVGQNTTSGAMNTARGLTSSLLKVDEGPFIPNVKISLMAAIPATSAARENAKKNGALYCTTYTTTPGYLSSESGRYFKSIYDSCARWTEHMLDSKDVNEFESTVRKNARGGRFQILLEFNHRQLGKTDEWLRERILELQADHADEEDIAANYLNKWAYGNVMSPISKEDLERIRNSKRTNAYKEISKEGYITNWYIPEYEVNNLDSNRQIILGMDSSEMIGNDDSALTGIDVKTGEVICTALINESNVITFSNYIANLLIKYPSITFIPESKSTGLPIIDNLVLILLSRGVNPFKRIYNKVVEDTNNEDRKDILMDRNLDSYYNKYRKEFGYRTSGTGANSRDNLYGTTFNNAIRYTAHLVRDPDLIDNLESLEIRNGRIDHPKGGHDDNVISLLLGFFFLLYATSKEVYGIDNRDVLRDIKLTIIDNQGGPLEIYRKEKQKELKNDIDRLLKELKSTKNPFIKQQLIIKIKFLYEKLDKSLLTTTFNLEELLDEIENESKLTAMSNKYSNNYSTKYRF